MSHTPLPWMAERQDEDSGDIYYAVHSSDKYQFITNVHSNKEDAHLIAAAPELLAALRALVDRPLRYNGHSIEIECDSFTDAMDRIRKARAVVSWATRL